MESASVGQTSERIGHATYLNLRSSNPPHRWQVILHQQVVGLVVESPLADDEVGSRILDPLDHLLELLRLVLLQLLVLLDRGNVELVLGLGARRLKGTGEDGNLGVVEGAGHLRVRHVLVEENSLDESGILERSSDLAGDLDEVERDILAVKVGDRENSIDSDLGKEVVGLGNAAKVAKVAKSEHGQLVEILRWETRRTYILLPILV